MDILNRQYAGWTEAHPGFGQQTKEICDSIPEASTQKNPHKSTKPLSVQFMYSWASIFAHNDTETSLIFAVKSF